MKERVAGIITLLSGVTSIVFGLFLITETNDYEVVLLFISIGIPPILYSIWTKFGSKRIPSLEKIEIENEILKKQIEQKELKKKLEGDKSYDK